MTLVMTDHTQWIRCTHDLHHMYDSTSPVWPHWSWILLFPSPSSHCWTLLFPWHSLNSSADNLGLLLIPVELQGYAVSHWMLRISSGHILSTPSPSHHLCRDRRSNTDCLASHNIICSPPAADIHITYWPSYTWPLVGLPWVNPTNWVMIYSSWPETWLLLCTASYSWPASHLPYVRIYMYIRCAYSYYWIGVIVMYTGKGTRWWFHISSYQDPSLPLTIPVEMHIFTTLALLCPTYNT